MYNIAICDDDAIICSQLEDILFQFNKIIGANITIDVFYSGLELERSIIEGSYYDMIFLDIEMKILNGIEIGKKIREEIKNEAIQIVYISAKESYAMDLFEIRPFHFIVKPLESDKICKIVKLGMELANKSCHVFRYKQGHRVKKKQIKDILYFQSMDRQTIMVTVEGEEKFYATLNEVFNQVSKYNFLFCHKSFLVNYFHIKDFCYSELKLSNGLRLPISQAKRKEVRDIQIKYEKEGI